MVFLKQNKVLITSFINTAFARGVSAIGSILLVIVVGKKFGASGVGLFVFVQTIYLGAALLARLGIDAYLVKRIAQSSTLKQKIDIFFSSVRRTFLTSLMFSFALLVLSGSISKYYNGENLDEYLYVAVALVPFTTLLFVAIGFIRGINKPGLASIFENGSVSLISVLLFLLIEEVYSDATLLDFFFCVFFSTIISLLLSLLVVKKDIEIGLADFIYNLFIKETSADKVVNYDFFFISAIQFSQQIIPVLVASYFLTEAELGLLKASEKVALAIGFVAMITNTVMPARLARSFSKGHNAEFLYNVRFGFLINAILAIPLGIIAVLYSDNLVAMLGDDFVGSGYLLCIFALAQTYNVLLNPSVFILNMTGNEGVTKKLSIFALFLSLTSMPFLMLYFGLFGAALSIVLYLIIQNSLAFYKMLKVLKNLAA
ncbi:lipopolysaccharide biosynthesis protein [Cobetia amphilecti]|uniref:lipopolysaccharide biosynthesis protein n=1 Tax=Cobetia amphilecti TaxID=1055104 RepID=UPI0026E1D968|nr:oligosaccharide flippase family protein [Cobetia amphilecti]MDO6815045.1 oligosaccharide flippase family protein [Cobetia amphilecti]